MAIFSRSLLKSSVFWTWLLVCLFWTAGIALDVAGGVIFGNYTYQYYQCTFGDAFGNSQQGFCAGIYHGPAAVLIVGGVFTILAILLTVFAVVMLVVKPIRLRRMQAAVYGDQTAYNESRGQMGGQGQVRMQDLKNAGPQV